MTYIAHLRESTGEKQAVRAHLEGTARLAQVFGDVFDSGAFSRFCGELHDAGKYSEAFQRRIRGENIRADHSTAGAQEAERRLPLVGHLLAYCIAGHHGGLPDGGSQGDTPADSTLMGRLRRPVEPYGAFAQENAPTTPSEPFPMQPVGKGGFTVAFWVRMIYSCLTDADFLDTESFMKLGNTGREHGEPLSVLWARLEKTISSFTGDRPINQKRCEILGDCLRAAHGERGLYSLTVPTGGGKTISSLAFALGHALHHGLRRVIYVIPYTSIIEQNAKVFEDIVGAENVLQHHANFDFGADDDGVSCPKKLAAENWDAPLVVTTNVQFFESLFAHKPSRCRKLHHIAGSIVIFDEAQMFPTEYLTPCVRAIAELVRNYRCTAVLCSATQPALDAFFPADMPRREICADPAGLAEFFRRTRIVPRGLMDNEALLQEMGQKEQVLCIVSTRAHALALFGGLEREGAFHLSTLMCPAHRRAVIDEIKRRLREGETCRVVSTQLIEAGVDVDFPSVYRSMAGLDSIVQSAGRCNREGRAALRDVYVFEPEEAYATLPSSLKRPAQIAKLTMRRHEDPLTPEAVRDYFTELYHTVGEQGRDCKNICRRLEEGMNNGFSFPFPEIAGDFRLIEEDTRAVVIPWGEEAREFIGLLRREGAGRGLMRKLQPYSVSVRMREWQALRDAGAVEMCDETAILIDEKLYRSETGLDTRAESGRGFFS